MISTPILNMSASCFYFLPLYFTSEKGRNVIYNRDVSNMHNLHKKKLDGMKSTLASLGYSAKPKTIPQVVRANLKKRMFEDERLAEIEVNQSLT